MNTRVVTISRQLGSGGEDVARQVAAALGFRYLDKEVIERAAAAAGVPADLISEAERNQPFRKRMLEAIATNPGWAALGWYEPVPDMRNTMYTSEHYRRLVEDVIRDVAKEGEAVILGHGAQVILRDRWDTVKVLVTGNMRLRTRWLREKHGLDLVAAERALARSDTERSCYFQRVYQETWLAPGLYDLSLNMDHLSAAAAVGATTSLARGR
ncbi:MAG: cytidylate kinase-like family protein [Dehalococcoidia bacterium]|nr:cytidylate kinase-like family protein [Dehalococcoidia bacterium]